MSAITATLVGRPPRRALLSAVLPAMLVLCTGLLVWPAVAHAVEVWSTTEEFSFGFLVVPVAVALVWWRRAALRRSIGSGANGGLAIVVPALLLYLLAHRIGINALAGLAVVPLLWGIVVYLWGWQTGRVLAFPIGFLAFGLVLYRGLLNSVGFEMQRVTALGAFSLGSGLGLDLARDGLVLQVGAASFVVAEACSGMSSLVSLLALAAVWTSLTMGSVFARVAMVASVLPLVIVANTVRVTIVLVIASWLGQDAALGFFHSISSLTLFGLALAGLLLVGRMVGCTLPRLATQS